MAEYTQRQLVDALRRADAAGDSKAAHAIARQIRNQQNALTKSVPALTIPRNPEQKQTALDGASEGLKESARALLAAAANVADIIPEVGDSVVEAAAWAGQKLGVGDGSYTPATRFKNMLPDWAKPQTTAGKIASEAIPYMLPESKAGDIPQIAEHLANAGKNIVEKFARSGVFRENAIGALANSDTGDKTQAESTLVENLAFGKVLNLSGKLLGVGYRAIKGNPDAAMKELVQLGERHGVPIHTTDIIRPESGLAKTIRTYGDQIPVLGTSSMRVAQQRSRQKLVTSLAEKYESPGDDEIYQSLVRQKDKIRQAAGTVYRDIESKMGDVTVDTSRTKDAINNVIHTLTRPGIIRDEASISALQRVKEQMSGAEQTHEMLKTNRTTFRDEIQGDRKVMPKNLDRLLQQISDAMTEDLHSGIEKKLGSQASSKYQKANAIYADEAQKLKNTNLKRIFERGGMIPEEALKGLYSKKPSEVKLFYRSLDEKGKDAARRELISKAIEEATEDNTGSPVINPTKFINNIKKINSQMGIAFAGDESKYIGGINNLLNITRHAQEAAASPATGQKNIPIGGAILSSMQGLAKTITEAAVAGSIGRLYESQLVRDAMIRISGTPADSTGFEQVVNAATDALSTAIRGGSDTLRGNAAKHDADYKQSIIPGAALIRMVRDKNENALGEVNSVVMSPEFQNVARGIQSGEGLTSDGADALNAKGNALQQTPAFQSLLDKLPPESRQAVEKFGAIQWLLSITQRYGNR